MSVAPLHSHTSVPADPHPSVPADSHLASMSVASLHTHTIVPAVPAGSHLASMLNAALEAYERKAKKDLTSHPLLPSLQSCNSPGAILAIFREQIPPYSQSQNGDDWPTNWVTPIVNVLYSFPTALGRDIGLVNIGCFPTRNFCSNICFSGILTGEHNLCGHW